MYLRLGRKQTCEALTLIFFSVHRLHNVQSTTWFGGLESGSVEGARDSSEAKWARRVRAPSPFITAISVPKED